MKILYITSIAGTINAFLIPHIKMLIDQGHTVDIACNNVKNLKPIINEYGCGVHEVEFSRSPLKIDNVKAYLKLKKIYIKNNYDLVHTHTPIASFIARLASKNIKSLKVIYTAHGFHFSKTTSMKNYLIYYLMEKVAANWTDGLLTINREDYLQGKKLMGERGVYKVNGVGINLEKFNPQESELKIQFRTEFGYTQKEFILFYAAELNNNKNQALLLEAIKLLKDKIPEIKLLLAGAGPLEEKYRNMIIEYELNKNVELLGIRRDVPKFLQMADLAVASSKREGLPVNVMEAMATGLPVIATDVRGHNDLIEDNSNGFLIEKNNPYQFAKAIYDLYISHEISKKFSEENIKKVKLYEISSVLKEMEKIYDEIL